jgi:hypothetical protein
MSAISTRIRFTTPNNGRINSHKMRTWHPALSRPVSAYFSDIHKLANSMRKGYWDANSCPDGQEIPRLLYGLLRCSHEATTCPYPKPDECRPHPPIPRKSRASHLYVRSFKWSLSFSVSCQISLACSILLGNTTGTHTSQDRPVSYLSSRPLISVANFSRN